ncbi:hypothetical protein [Nocardia flavorosea]|uniref:Uncharacterized protein n=1 Tax=Nocardia flavorosea TaxID=53429 RepID=A0A846YB12_9NOCA|nr:hypothetical protein [Nocardia flavorosea]NKY55735.1 hypothetical protein [Nocardia flavorosea]
MVRPALSTTEPKSYRLTRTAQTSAAVVPGIVEGVLLIASFAPFGAEGLDYIDGMGAQNIAQFGAPATNGSWWPANSRS